MKQEAGQFPIFPDGSIDFGNGVIGPSASDRDYFNTLRYSDQKPPILKESTLSSPKLKPNLKGLGFFSTAMTSALILSACSSGETQTVTDNSDNEPPGLALPFDGTGFLNSGPHNFRLERDAPTENEIVSELDFAPKPVIKCEPGVRAIVTDWNITASESGKVTVVGDERNESDPNHSIIQIKHPDGKSTRYTHVANIQVKKDQEVTRRQKLGNPSCEYPPSGSTTGLHLDFSVLDSHENLIDVRTITLSGWKIQGNRNYQGTMTKDGKTITADRRRCPEENPCDGGKIVNSITHASSKTSGKAVLGAAAGPARPGPISAAVGEKPVQAETPKPTPTPIPTVKKEIPIPTIVSPEKEIVNPIVLLPIKVEEKNVSPGWKSVSVKGFVAENRSNKVVLVPLNNNVLSKTVLRSQEGFEYKNPDNNADWNCFGFKGSFYNKETLAQAQHKISPDLLRILKIEDNFIGSYYILNSLPPHFRVRGSFNYNTRGNISADDIELCKKGLKFIAGEKTSGYRLNVPNFPEISLQNDIASIDKLKFPTDRPDSDFKNPGTTINIPGKGSVAFEGAVSRTSIAPFTAELPGTKVKVRFRFHNDSIGYDQKFMLTIKLFGDDGILYTAMDDRAMNMFPTQPLYWDGYPIYDYAPPGNDKIAEVDIVTSSSLKSGKLVVSGDINEIFNLSLPEITNPIKR